MLLDILDMVDIDISVCVYIYSGKGGTNDLLVPRKIRMSKD